MPGQLKSPPRRIKAFGNCYFMFTSDVCNSSNTLADGIGGK